MRSALVLALTLVASLSVTAATKADIDALTTYAVTVGRGVACGINISPEMERIGKWMDRRFPPGSQDQQTYLPIFIEGVRQHALLQKEGRSPDSCAKVREQYPKVRWP